MERNAFQSVSWIVVALLVAMVIGYAIAPHVIHPEKVWLTDSATPNKKDIQPFNPDRVKKSPPPPPSMERMKREGCIADGILSSYGHEATNIEMMRRMPCYSFHRALQTWLEPPDFKRAESIMKKVDRPEVVWGIMLAEAIDVNEEYYYADEDRLFSFRKMCRPGMENRWGEHTCVPSTERKEYRRYIEYVTRQAMDLGIQNFFFGQMWLQDDTDNTEMPGIIAQMRKDAEARGIEIVIGAQTNDIDDESYLRMFDYIEGGVGLHENGSVEDTPCFSKWWKKEGDWCWALLWNDRFRLKAKNVWVHLDWSGKRGDDMSTFARMSASERAQTLRTLHKKFTGQGVGFILPLMTALPERNGGCYGEEERFYSANDKFGCKDEGVIRDILTRAWK